MNLLVFNLKHGLNLGDRLISRCVEAAICEIDPSINVVTEDLGGRSKPGSVGGKRLLIFAILERLPKLLRLMIVELMLARLVRRVTPLWRQRAAAADAIVIGGGGIFADSDLNFPMKLAGVLAVAAETGRPVAILAVGVAKTWSRRGRTYFTEALARARLVFVSMRDRASIDTWNKLFAPAGAPEPIEVPDPALLASRYFAAATTQPEPSRVGLCITSWQALRYHGETRLTAAALANWYVDFVAALALAGCSIALFTTGLPEDGALLELLAHRCEAQRLTVEVVPSFDTVEQFLAFISRCSTCVGHRLHVIIAAYSYRIPALALAWDSKMQSQLELLGHPERLIDPQAVSAPAAARQTRAIMTEGVAVGRWQQLTDDALSGIAALVSASKHGLAP